VSNERITAGNGLKASPLIDVLPSTVAPYETNGFDCGVVTDRIDGWNLAMDDIKDAIRET
jgi:hypothetical protein